MTENVSGQERIMPRVSGDMVWRPQKAYRCSPSSGSPACDGVSAGMAAWGPEPLKMPFAVFPSAQLPVAVGEQVSG